MTRTAGDPESVQPAVGAPSNTATDEQLIAMLVDRAHNEGLQLTGEGGLLQQLTKRVLESALEGEITDHVGYEKHDPAGKYNGNSRNGTRAKTVVTDVGLVEVKVPRDTAGNAQVVPVRGSLRRWRSCPGWCHRRSAGSGNHCRCIASEDVCVNCCARAGVEATMATDWIQTVQ